MAEENHNDQIYKIMTEINQPISERNLSRRLNVPVRQVKYHLKNNPDKYTRATPIEVGSGKYDYTKQKNFNKKFRVRKSMHVWKLRIEGYVTPTGSEEAPGND